MSTKDYILGVRMTKTEHIRVQNFSNALNMKMSAFARIAIIAHMEYLSEDTVQYLTLKLFSIEQLVASMKKTLKERRLT